VVLDGVSLVLHAAVFPCLSQLTLAIPRFLAQISNEAAVVSHSVNNFLPAYGLS
jgi:hypothetical protein